jgi:dinuclear metal center YbgI/SA1388 family protein
MKEIKASQLYSYLNDLFPQSLAAEWDRVGFQIPEVFNLQSQDLIRNAVICLDVTKEVIDYAIEKRSNLIISRHPFIFNDYEVEFENEAKKKSYDRLVENEIQVFSIHTNYDSSEHQVIEKLLESELNIKESQTLESEKEVKSISLFDEIELGKLADKVKFIFGSVSAKMSRNVNVEETIKKFYICSGAGASFMSHAHLTNTTFITGEAKWNEFIYAVENNVNLITIGHYMENYFIDDIHTKLTKTFNDELDCFAFDIKNMWINR